MWPFTEREERKRWGENIADRRLNATTFGVLEHRKKSKLEDKDLIVKEKRNKNGYMYSAWN